MVQLADEQALPFLRQLALRDVGDDADEAHRPAVLGDVEPARALDPGLRSVGALQPTNGMEMAALGRLFHGALEDRAALAIEVRALELGPMDRTLVARAAENLERTVVLPHGLVVLEIPVEDAQRRRFRGDAQALGPFRERHLDPLALRDVLHDAEHSEDGAVAAVHGPP